MRGPTARRWQYRWRCRCNEVLVGEDDTPIELFLAALDSRQDERSCQRFERAAQREELIGTVPDVASAYRSERRHAQATTVAALEVGKLRCRVVAEGRKCGERSREEGAACNRSRHDLSIVI